MRCLPLFLMLLVSLPAAAQNADQDQSAADFRNLPWQRGPGSGTIAGKATIKLGGQDAFLGEQGTRKLIVLMGNPPQDGSYAIVPTTAGNWVGIFNFNPSGYVRDDEKIDPEGLMTHMKEREAESNAERTRLGLTQLRLEGWHVPPHYDSQTKRLEWGTRFKDEKGNIFVNYTVRLLGRTGVMSAILLSDPTDLDTDRSAFVQRLKGFQFNTGETYTEFRQGDKVAEYGLAALVVGGAAAVAAKKGLFAVIGGFLVAFWKLVVGGVIAATAALHRMFKSKKS